MSITVKFFARLREDLGMDEYVIEDKAVKTIADAWRAATNDRPMPANTLMALNMEYVDAGHAVQQDDEVAFFPPVTGG